MHCSAPTQRLPAPLGLVVLVQQLVHSWLLQQAAGDGPSQLRGPGAAGSGQGTGQRVLLQGEGDRVDEGGLEEGWL